MEAGMGTAETEWIISWNQTSKGIDLHPASR
jgi:hypothetical protein